MTKPDNKQTPRVRDLAKAAASITKSNIVHTFTCDGTVSNQPLVGESKIDRPEPAPVTVPMLEPRNLLVRSASGLLYVALNLLAVFLGKYWCALLMSIMAGICCWEFLRLMRADAKVPNQVLAILFAVQMPLVATVDTSLLSGLIFLLVMLLGSWYVIDEQVRITDVAVSLFGAVYTGLTLSALVAIRSTTAMSNEAAVILCIGVMASVWINDAAAYLVGSAFGKHKMAPRISPKKSWEGFIGGLLGSVLVWCLFLLFPQTGITLPVALVCGIVCGVVGVIGDLVESRIKRGAGQKDSGNLIPGHGGLLDRCDSLLFVSIAAYFLLRLMGVI